jgi:hypothetical protein
MVCIAVNGTDVQREGDIKREVAKGGSVECHYLPSSFSHLSMVRVRVVTWFDHITLSLLPIITWRAFTTDKK